MVFVPSSVNFLIPRKMLRFVMVVFYCVWRICPFVPPVVIVLGFAPGKIGLAYVLALFSRVIPEYQTEDA